MIRCTLPAVVLAAALLALPEAVPAQASVPSTPQATPLEALVWMAGCWEGSLAGGALYEESWMPPRSGLMLGTARMTREGRVLSWEFLRIAEQEEGLVYLPQPGGGPVTAFALRESAEGSVVFENPAHDFPQRILYRLTGARELVARIEGERDGRSGAMEFPLARVACPMEPR